MSRRATHSGEWYSGEPDMLSVQLEALISAAEPHHSKTRGLIVPHAGYRFSGEVSARAYKAVVPDTISRIFIIGPCHHQYIDGCALPEPSSVTQYDTPIGPFPLDVSTIKELRSQSEAPFRSFRNLEDEEEHSIEMQLPFLRHIFRGRPDVGLVPIYVGALLQNEERLYGRALAKYFEDPSSFFVVTSDFSHWGNRFRFTPRDFPEPTNIQYYRPDTMNGKIEALDRQGMDLIARQDCEGFAKYLQTTGNTICGRHALLIFLQVLRHTQSKAKIEFVHYLHSNELPTNVSREDYCVAYAAGVVTI